MSGLGKLHLKDFLTRGRHIDIAGSEHLPYISYVFDVCIYLCMMVAACGSKKVNLIKGGYLKLTNKNTKKFKFNHVRVMLIAESILTLCEFFQNIGRQILFLSSISCVFGHIKTP